MRVIRLSLFFLLFTIVHTTLFDSLNQVVFVNQGVVTNSDRYVWLTPSISGGDFFYLEPENITNLIEMCGQNAWAQNVNSFKYPYRPVDPPPPCTSVETRTGYDMPGGDFYNFEINSTDPTSVCLQACCEQIGCTGWVYDVAPSNFNACAKGSQCCYLKNVNNPFTASSGPIVSGTVSSSTNVEHPPSGVRSAVPLGGISTGSVELRADGTLNAWTIMNQSPAGAAKIGTYPAAFFATRVNGKAKVIQTQPFVNGLNGVDALNYSGSYPISRLTVLDSDLTQNVINRLSLYGFSAYRVNDMEASARPAIAFSLAVEAGPTQPTPLTVDFMFQVPLNIETDQIRKGTTLRQVQEPDTSSCLQACQSNSSCASWYYVRSTLQCTLQTDAPHNAYELGVDSGLRYQWSVDPSALCLTSNRPGTGPAHGNFSICVTADGYGLSIIEWGYGTADKDSALYTSFASTGSVNSSNLAGAYGALSIRAIVPASTQATFTITFGWYFPYRDHYGAVMGNQYAATYKNSQDAAWGNSRSDLRSGDLSSVVNDILSLHLNFYDTSLPPWLADQLMNSLSHIRSAMWFSHCPNCHASQDTRLQSRGFWRQWEAYDCNDMDSIHNDGERHIPYIMIFPDSERSKLAAWAGNQDANGMLEEQLLETSPDTPGNWGRIMSDCSSAFVIEVLELYRWSGDSQTLKLYYPTVVKAAQWMISTTTRLGVPYKLETTYDLLGFPEYDVSAYATVFHLAAMQAAIALATVMGDSATAQACSDNFAQVRAAFDLLEWSSSGYYAGASNGCTKGQGCSQQVGLFADAFYAQVLAYSVGLGTLVADPQKLITHLNSTVVRNCAHPAPNGSLVADCPNGLLTYTGRSPIGSSDYEIWQMLNHDFATLSLRLNAFSVDDSLLYSGRSATSWSQRVNDQWATSGLSDWNGTPTCTTHYGYHMTSWHVPLALSGQTAQISPAEKTFLRFVPRLKAPYILPLYLPGVFGTVEATSTQFIVTLRVGALQLDELSVNGIICPVDLTSGKVIISVGSPAKWSTTKISESFTAVA